MRRLLAGLALLTACHGKHPSHGRSAARPTAAVARSSAAHGAGSDSLVPKLPLSPDGVQEMKGLDQRTVIHRADPPAEITALMARAPVRGLLQDYVDALALTAGWIAKDPKNPAAWKARAGALSAVHKFTEARAAIEHLPYGEREEPLLAIDEATGHFDRSLPEREKLAKLFQDPAHLAAYGGALELVGRFDDALAQMKLAAAAVHDNSAELLSWLLFQWGRVYELQGQPAAARELYEASRARLPGFEQADAHLAQAMIATGDQAGARTVVEQALADNRHPELVALAAQLAPPGPQHDALLAEARAGWEKYVTALPEAFSDHAARFYLGVGANPARALVLARANLANRATPEARALVIDAALAANDPKAACAVVDPLITGPGTPGQRFSAWKALSSCGRTADAAKLGAALGISK